MPLAGTSGRERPARKPRPAWGARRLTRFGRSDIFGQGPVNGVCPPPAVPIQCTSDGYVSRNAWGYRLFGALRYANVADGVDLVAHPLFRADGKSSRGI